MEDYKNLLDNYSLSIPVDSYLCIKESDIYINDVITETYNGRPIWNKKPAIMYFNNSRLLFFKEFNINISEFHILQASNLTGGIPIPCTTGNYSWERIKTFDGRYSQWVVTDFYPSETYCSCNSAADSGNLTRANSAFRKGLINSLPSINPLSISKIEN